MAEPDTNNNQNETSAEPKQTQPPKPPPAEGDERKPLLGKALVTWLALVQQGKVADVNPRAYNELAELSEEQQVQALQGYSDSHATIRNQSGFLIGIVRRIHRTAGEKQYVRSDLDQEVQDKLKLLESEGRLDGAAFDKKLINELGKFPKDKQLEALETFQGTDPITVKNPIGFLAGIIKRLARSAGLDASNREVPEKAKNMLEEAYKNNQYIKEGDLDERCMRALRAFPPHLAIQLVEDFLSSDLATVKNMGGFFYGIIKRYDRKYNLSVVGGNSDRRGYGRGDRDRDYRGSGYGDRDYRERDRDYRDGYGSRDYDRRSYGGGGGGYGSGYGYGGASYGGNYGSGGGDYDYREAGARRY